MRNKIKHLLASKALKPKGLGQVRQVLGNGPRVARRSPERQRFLKCLREIAKDLGLPPGFHKVYTSEELERERIASKRQLESRIKNIDVKAIEKSFQMKEDLKKLTVNDYIMFAASIPKKRN